MSEDMGGLIWLPSIAAAPDPERVPGRSVGGLETPTAGTEPWPGHDPETDTFGASNDIIRREGPLGMASRGCRRFLSHLRGVQNLSHNTVRAYQTDVKLFLDFAGDAAYDWNTRCAQLFGTVFSQVLSELNRATHAQESGEASKRPFSIQELQEFFDLADLEPERILNSGRKGALAAWRDAVMFKTIYAWGLRHNEARHLILADFSRNVRAPSFGEWGVLRVRHGKAMQGFRPETTDRADRLRLGHRDAGALGPGRAPPVWAPPGHSPVPHRYRQNG